MELEDIFLPGGALSETLDSYAFRESQLEMATLVETGFRESKHIVVEAGTGIGKSFAYLAPAFRLCADNLEKKVIIATSTITLERQLYDKDIPLIKKALGIDLPVAILFGRNNYLCRRRYTESYMERALLTTDEDIPEAKLDKWVKETETGCRVDAPNKIVGKLMEPLLADSEDCMGYRCPYYESCFFYNARRQAQKSRIIVTNHHILLLDAKNRAESMADFDEDVVLPGYTHVIVDEAHHIEDEATEILSDVFSSERVSNTLDKLTRKQAKFGNQSILAFLSVAEKNEFKGIVKTIEQDIAHTRTLLLGFDTMMKEILSKFYRDKSVLFTPEFYNVFRSRIAEGEALAEILARLAANIGNAFEKDEENAVHFDLVYRYALYLNFLSDTLRNWMRFNDFDSKIPYAEEKKGEYEIRIAPMSTGPILSSALLSHLESLLYCSATLSVNNQFDYFSERSGLLEEKSRVLEGNFHSPFDYGRSLMYLLPLDGRAFSNETSIQYHEYVSKSVIEAIKGSGGGALVLFTSKAMMKEAYEKAKEEIGDDFTLLCQEDRGSKSLLLSRFKNEVDSSLFATSSFWEGVDAPGDTLRLVIIVKLPFTVPTEPIAKARENYINKIEPNTAFIKLAVPQATIKLKQGIGRLIRSEDDKGVVLILDNRLLSKGYGRMMMHSLPPGYIPEDALLSNLPDKIERFLF